MSERCPLISQDGVSLIVWIQAVSGSCVYGNLSAVSWMCGCISFCCWLCAQLPQVAENYINQSVEGLSYGFLLNWFIGDFTNLMGCILTHQLPFQTALAFYYVCIDLVLGAQYIYYARLDKHKRVIKLIGNNQILEAHRIDQEGHACNDSDDSTVTVHKSVPIPTKSRPSTDLLASSQTPSFANPKLFLTSSFVASFSKANATPLYITDRFTNIDSYSSSVELIGDIMAWSCTLMYLISRLPQIFKNYRRKSTRGTSILLFMATFTGNTTYSLSILLSPQARGANKSSFLMNETPFLIGSAGTVVFDIIIFIQHYIYSRQSSYTLSSYSDEHRGYSSDSSPSATSTSVHPVNIGESRFHPKDTTPLAYSLQTNYSE